MTLGDTKEHIMINSETLTIDQDTIVALASGTPPSAIGIIRITGENCHQLLRPLIKIKTSRISYGKLYLAKFIEPLNGEIIDEPMVCFFKSPHSYTGQDSIEIFVHGGRYIIQRCLKLIYATGIRHAKPGEFTKRAYLFGKLDLTEAEGIRALIDATSHLQWKAAKQLSSGNLRKHIDTLRLQILESMAWLEAKIDFPDEKETSEVEFEKVDEKVVRLQQTISKLIETYNSGKVASNGLSVALVGKPNAGKSTLLNCILNEDRAIVSSQAGTTRDYLKESCLIDGRLINLIDTAGIRSGGCRIEKMGIERSMELAKSADLRLLLLPSDDETEQEFKEWQELFNDMNPDSTIPVLTKADLARPVWWKKINHPHKLEISITGSKQLNVELLLELLKNKVDNYSENLSNDAFISSARHKASLALSLKHLAEYTKGRTLGSYEEMLAFELRLAAQSLGEIIGKVENEDVLDVVFSSFCVGK